MDMNEHERKIMVRKTFDTVAAGYDNASLRFFSESAGHLAACLELKGGEHVLDVSTGTGCAALALAERLPQGWVTGIDFSKGMLERAIAKRDSRNISNVEFIEMDMQALEFPDDYFDAATCAFAIFFVDDMERQLRHIAEKVKTGGSVTLTTFREGTFSPLVDIFYEHLRQYRVEIPPMTWERINTADKFAGLLEKAGLKDVGCAQKNVGYHLNSVDDWWELIWNGGFRRLVNQLAADDHERFKTEHLEEIEKLSSGGGIWLEVNVLFATGTKK